MSKRTIHSRNAAKTNFTFLVIPLILFFTVSTTALAQNWYGNTAVYIGGKGDVPLGSIVDVDVGLLKDTLFERSFGGYDLLMIYDPKALAFVGAFQGALLDSCEWESFQYQQGSMLPGRYFVHLMAVADLDNGAHHPSSFLGGKSGQLAFLRFQFTSDSAYMWNNITQIECYWNDCSDNTFNSTAGDSVFFAQDVYDWSGPYPPPPHLGTVHGAPDSCLGVADGRVHTRLISYIDGFINNWSPDSIDSRGDLNLNGIPYEIADEMMYVDYFLHGLGSWQTPDLQLSIATSDINCDGLVLTYLDAVYLYRVIVGDALPCSKRTESSNLDAYFSQDTANHRLEVSFAGELAGAYILFQGNITPTFTVPPGFIQEYSFDGYLTRVLIIGDLAHRYGSGVWFTYDGEGTLHSASTADFFNSFINAHVVGGDVVCGDLDGSSWIDIADAVRMVSYIFASGSPPVDSHHGDSNCDGMVNISDAVYLIGYIFAGGPLPCAVCK